MIIMGAGINHWFNSDTIYRAILNLVILTASQGVNGGGWAHYVGPIMLVRKNVGRSKAGPQLPLPKTGKVRQDSKMVPHSFILRLINGSTRKWELNH